MDKKIFQIIGACLLGLLMLGGFLLILKFFNVFSLVDSNIVAGLITISSTILVSILIVVLSKHFDRKSERLAQLREKKIPLYEKLTKSIFYLYFGKELSDEEDKLKSSEVITFRF